VPESDVTALEPDVTLLEHDLALVECNVTVLECNLTPLEPGVTVAESNVTVTERDVSLAPANLTSRRSHPMFSPGCVTSAKLPGIDVGRFRYRFGCPGALPSRPAKCSAKWPLNSREPGDPRSFASRMSVWPRAWPKLLGALRRLRRNPFGLPTLKIRPSVAVTQK
jgi:hypothetical protein